MVVSLSERICDHATNALTVIHNAPHPERDSNASKRRVGVCVKALETPFNDMSVRLTEWLEAVRSLGADKVFVYWMSLHPNVTKVLAHYEREGLVETTQLPLPGDQVHI